MIKRVLRCGQNRRWRGACRSPYREYGQGKQRCHRRFWPQPREGGGAPSPHLGTVALRARCFVGLAYNIGILLRSAFAHRARSAAVAHAFGHEIGSMRYVGAAWLAALAAFSLPMAPVPAAAADFRSALDDAVVLYDAPSAQSKKLFIVSQGYPLEVVVVLQGWIKVRDAAGALSWVEASKVSVKPRTVMVKVPSAAIRQAADETSPVVFQAQQNVVLELTEAAGGWLRVRHRDGASGFIRVSQVWGV